jgi:hypothetical protein
MVKPDEGGITDCFQNVISDIHIGMLVSRRYGISGARCAIGGAVVDKTKFDLPGEILHLLPDLAGGVLLWNRFTSKRSLKN